jgi:hypothetical protein
MSTSIAESNVISVGIDRSRSTPTLCEIDLGGRSGKNSCEHQEIKENTNYLCLIYGQYCAGSFSRQWYGWNFNGWGASGCQLKSPGIEALWEIVE